MKRFHLFWKCNCAKVIGRGPRTTKRTFGDIFKSRQNTKFKASSKFASSGRKGFIWKPVPQKGTSSRCVLFIHKPSKHDYVICGAQKYKLQERQISLGYLFKNLNFASLATARKPKLRQAINKSSDTLIFFLYYFLGEIFHHFRKSRGPRTTYCTPRKQRKCLHLATKQNLRC